MGCGFRGLRFTGPPTKSIASRSPYRWETYPLRSDWKCVPAVRSTPRGKPQKQEKPYVNCQPFCCSCRPPTPLLNFSGGMRAPFVHSLRSLAVLSSSRRLPVPRNETSPTSAARSVNLSAFLQVLPLRCIHASLIHVKLNRSRSSHGRIALKVRSAPWPHFVARLVQPKDT